MGSAQRGNHRRIMSTPENRIVSVARDELAQLREDLHDFDAEMIEAGADATLRYRLRRWWEERIGGRVLDRGEARLRGTQGRN